MRRAVHLVLGTAILCSFNESTEARRVVAGFHVPEHLIIAVRPPESKATPFSRELWDKFGFDKDGEHCNLMNSDGSLGRITFNSILGAYNGIGYSYFKTPIVPIRAKEPYKVLEAIADTLLKYALTSSKGDIQTARNVVMNAESHDAHCLRLEFQEKHDELERNSLGQMSISDLEGNRIIFWLPNPAKIPSLITNRLTLMKMTLDQMRRVSNSYKNIYDSLDNMERSRTKTAATNQTSKENLVPEKDAGPLTSRPVPSPSASLKPNESVTPQGGKKSDAILDNTERSRTKTATPNQTSKENLVPEKDASPLTSRPVPSPSASLEPNESVNRPQRETKSDKLKVSENGRRIDIVIDDEREKIARAVRGCFGAKC